MGPKHGFPLETGVHVELQFTEHFPAQSPGPLEWIIFTFNATIFVDMIGY